MVRGLREAVSPLFDRPFAIFGHSFGSVLAFELARELRRRGDPEPVLLCLSGHRPPSMGRREMPLAALPDDEFVEQVCRLYGGIPRAVLEEPELLALCLLSLRADFTLLERYLFEPEEPLSSPLLLLAGRDDPCVDARDLEAWRALSRGPSAVHWFPGAHFYLHEQGRIPFLQCLAGELNTSSSTHTRVASLAGPEAQDS
jgi:surfactin synthase thioesterase subunit